MNYESKKRVKWTVESIENLLEVWKNYSHQLRGTKENTHVYSAMGCEMEERGIIVTPKELRDKVNNMSQKYRNERNRFGTGPSRSPWQFYKQVHKIIGGYPCNSLKTLDESDAPDYIESYTQSPLNEMQLSPKREFVDSIDSSSVAPVQQESNSTGVATASPSETPIKFSATRNATLPSRKRKSEKSAFQNELLLEFKKSNNIVRKELAAHRELTEIIVERDKEFQNEIIKFQNEFLEILRKDK